MLDNNTNIKLIADYDDLPLAHRSGKTLPVDPSHPLFDNTIQWNIKTKQAYSSNVVINHILSICRKCNICKNNLVIDSEIKEKKRTWAENTGRETKDNSMKSQATLNVNSIIGSHPTNTII